MLPDDNSLIRAWLTALGDSEFEHQTGHIPGLRLRTRARPAPAPRTQKESFSSHQYRGWYEQRRSQIGTALGEAFQGGGRWSPHLYFLRARISTSWSFSQRPWTHAGYQNAYTYTMPVAWIVHLLHLRSAIHYKPTQAHVCEFGAQSSCLGGELEPNFEARCWHPTSLGVGVHGSRNSQYPISTDRPGGLASLTAGDVMVNRFRL